MANYNLIDILVGVVTAIIMFGTGLSLTLNDFKKIFISPKAISAALVSQMIALPCIAFIIAFLAPIQNEFKIGIIILASTPGGATSAFITYLLKGNVALSISLTAINSFLSLISIPFIVALGLKIFEFQNAGFELPILSTIIQIFIITIIPTTVGLYFRHYKEILAVKVERYVKVVMIVLLLAVFFIKFFASESNGGVVFKSNDFTTILPIAFLFNICCLLFGYYFLKILRLQHKSSITAAVESSVHNTPLAILIAGTLIGNQEMVKPVLLYALFSFWTALVFGIIMNRLVKPNELNN